MTGQPVTRGDPSEHRHMMAANIARAGAFVWMGVIFALSSLPGSAVPGKYGSAGHFAVYAVLGALYFVALRHQRPALRAVMLAVALASAYGVTDEFHQSFVPGRVPDVADWAVDTAGALAGAAFTSALVRQKQACEGPRKPASEATRSDIQ